MNDIKNACVFQNKNTPMHFKLPIYFIYKVHFRSDFENNNDFCLFVRFKLSYNTKRHFLSFFESFLNEAQEQDL